MNFLERLLRRLIPSREPSRGFELDGKLIQSVQVLAGREDRPDDEVAADLISFALAHREAAEENLRRWRTLSPREQQVVALVCCNLTSRQIAQRLYISPETVKVHVRNALTKFGVRNRYELRLALADWDFRGWIAENIGG